MHKKNTLSPQNFVNEFTSVVWTLFIVHVSISLRRRNIRACVHWALHGTIFVCIARVWWMAIDERFTALSCVANCLFNFDWYWITVVIVYVVYLNNKSRGCNENRPHWCVQSLRLPNVYWLLWNGENKKKMNFSWTNRWPFCTKWIVMLNIATIMPKCIWKMASISTSLCYYTAHLVLPIIGFDCKRMAHKFTLGKIDIALQLWP